MPPNSRYWSTPSQVPNNYDPFPVRPRSLPERPSAGGYRVAAKASSPGRRSDPGLGNLWVDKLAPQILVSSYPAVDPAHTSSTPQEKEGRRQRRRLREVLPVVSSTVFKKQQPLRAAVAIRFVPGYCYQARSYRTKAGAVYRPRREARRSSGRIGIPQLAAASNCWASCASALFNFRRRALSSCSLPFAFCPVAIRVSPRW